MEPTEMASAYYDEQAMAWCCSACDAVLLDDGDCPRCDAESSDQSPSAIASDTVTAPLGPDDA